MNQITKAVLTLLLIGAVLVYTIMNYVNGRTDFTMFLVCIVILGIPMVNMINLLIQELKKK
ncbi:MAG: hypothetical protein IJ001_03125 [Oscillospiraceae bacterium]|nr:hypothetical protein [Oscillospiraceae bacterium]